MARFKRHHHYGHKYYSNYPDARDDEERRREERERQAIGRARDKEPEETASAPNMETMDDYARTGYYRSLSFPQRPARESESESGYQFFRITS